jgi:hypothetical protein
MDLFNQIFNRRDAADLDAAARRIVAKCRRHSECECTARAAKLREQAEVLRAAR